MSVTKFLSGFAIGAAIVAIAGILLAPQSGAETREMANWCLKNYFIPDLNATFSMSGFIRGDYKVRF